MHLILFFTLTLLSVAKSHTSAQTQPNRAPLTFSHKELCRFDRFNRAVKPSRFYRGLAFQALKNCNHTNPKKVILTNNQNELAACVYSYDFQNTSVKAINFNEKGDFGSTSFGVKNIVMHHEAIHLILKHCTESRNNPTYYPQCQREEREADKKGIEAAQCKQCTLDWIQYFLTQHKKNDAHKKPLLKFNALSLSWLDQQTDVTISQMIKTATQFSVKRNAEHPCNIERALRAYKESRSINSSCSYHKKIDI